MPRKLYKFVNDEFVEVYDSEKARLHFIQQDTMAPTRHPVDGQIYESKSAFREVTYRNGFVELGNDKIAPGIEKARAERAKEIREKRIECLRELSDRRYSDMSYIPMPIVDIDYD